MSTSADNLKSWKPVWSPLLASVFLFVFNLVYGLFAHGVSSVYMTYAFLIPLIGGSLLNFCLRFLPKPSEFSAQLWRMGLITLVTGFLLHGVFDIYGSQQPLVQIFFYVAFALMGAAIVLYGFTVLKHKSDGVSR